MEANSETLRPEELLAHAGWMTALAARLVRDPDAADDLAQDTWLAALRHPPRRDQPTRAWLRRVARNLVRNQRRTDARREDREQRSALTAEPRATDDVVAELEAQRLLVEALLELKEPVRSTVVLRYFRGLNASEIGQLQSLPAGTVRWRLKRGLDELRERLDERFAGERRAWCLALAPLAAREGAAALGGALTVGVVAMSTALKVTVGILAAGQTPALSR